MTQGRIRRVILTAVAIVTGGVGGLYCTVGALLGECASDSDCVLDCISYGCCGTACPCDAAVTTAEAQRRADGRLKRCGDSKVLCSGTPVGSCDFDARFRARCDSGRCVSEQIEGGAAPEHRAPSLPARVELEDVRSRACMRGSQPDSCETYASWQCRPDESCHASIPCAAACCEHAEPQPAPRAEAPWASLPTKSAPGEAAWPNPTGTIAFALTRNRDAIVGLIGADGERYSVVQASLTREAGALRVSDGGRGLWAASPQTGLVRIALPGGVITPIAAGEPAPLGFDVDAKGQTAWITRATNVGPALFRLDLHTGTREPVAWSAGGDANPRLSPDGRRIVVAHWGPTHRPQDAVIDLDPPRLHGRPGLTAMQSARWHPSGQFLVAWRVVGEQAARRCELALVSSDLQAFAPLPVSSLGEHCGALAISPDGRWIAAITQGVDVNSNAENSLVITALDGSSTPWTLAVVDEIHTLEWIAFALDELGLETRPIAELPR